MAPREESFWSKYSTKKKAPPAPPTANRNPLYNRLTREGAGAPPRAPGQPPKKPNVAPVAASLIGPPAAAAALDQVTSSQPTPGVPASFAETPFGPTATPTDLIPAATPDTSWQNLGNLGPTAPADATGYSGGVGPLGVGAGAATGYLQGSAIVDTVKGKKTNPLQNAAMFPLDGGASFVKDPILNAVGLGNKREAGNQSRKDTNAALMSNGFLEKDYSVQLADGNRFNFGDDELQGKNLLNDRSYNLNWDDPQTGELVGAVQPLVDAMLPNGNDQRAREQATAKLVNAALASGDPLANIKGFYNAGGFADRNAIYGKITELSQDAERMAPEQRDAYYAAIDKLFGVGGPAAAQTQSAQSSGGSSGGGSSRQPSTPPPSAPPPPGLPPTPVTPDTNFVQAITDTYAHNTSDPVTTLLNPVTAPPFSPSEPSSLDVQPLARRRNNPLLRRRR